MTREEIRGFALNVAVAVVSVAVAVLGGAPAVTLAGLIYLLIFPPQTINGRGMNSRRRREGVAADLPKERGGRDEEP